MRKKICKITINSSIFTKKLKFKLIKINLLKINKILAIFKMFKKNI